MRFSKLSQQSVAGSVITIALLAPFTGSTPVAAKDPTAKINPFRDDQLTRPQDACDPFIHLSCEQAANIIPRTIVPLTDGRFVADGDHWVFVADYPEFSEVIVPQQRQRQAPNNKFRTVSTAIINSLDYQPAATYDQKDDLGNPLRTDSGAVAIDSESSVQVDVRYRFPERIVVADDLMLRRVTSQIGSQSCTDRWSISGEIVAGQDGQRLRIHTADSADSPFRIE